MKIKKYKKLSGGKYQVVLNNQELVLYDDIIIKHQLLLSSEIDEKKLKKVIEDNDIHGYYMLALNYIKKRLRSKKEIVAYLHKKEISNHMVSKVVQRLEDNNCINDLVFAKAYIHDKISYSSDGPYKIMNQLEKLGIDSSIINDTMSAFSPDLQLEKINKYIDKQVKTNRNKSLMILKNKLLNNLLNSGYDRSKIQECLSKIKVNDEEIYQKEYDKEYRKLSKKYTGQELEYKLKQKMYQKGFTK